MENIENLSNKTRINAPKIEFNKTELENWFSRVENHLLDKSQIHIINYEDKNCETNFDKLNKTFLNDIDKKSVVYCIWVGDSKDNLKPCYVGHAKETISKYRMIAHFSRKNKATGSQLEKIKKAIEDDFILGATFIQIEPAYMRTSIEEWLIIKHSDKLFWNRNGRVK